MVRRLSDTISRLHAAPAASPPLGEGAGLQQLTAFGSNPGALSAWYRVPEGAAALPLVVVLHGCTQDAAGYDRGSGWSELADRFGIALLFPEQTRANNPNRCFNWFVPEDIRRDGGEALSIRQMIAAMADRHGIDPARIFVTGLSAGGAMTSVMLATYPELFAGGAIIAGLPFGSAASVSQALDRMRGHGHPGEDAYAAAIRAASPHKGRWPAISVWHGSADMTVHAGNADRIVGQWRALHGLAERPDRDAAVHGHRHRAWLVDGEVRLEDYRIANMGHGTPLGTDPATACGTPMAHMLDVGISSTWHIAERWGLLIRERVAARAPRDVPGIAAATASVTPPVVSQPNGIQATIEAALRSAGLMR